MVGCGGGVVVVIVVLVVVTVFSMVFNTIWTDYK